MGELRYRGAEKEVRERPCQRRYMYSPHLPRGDSASPVHSRGGWALTARRVSSDTQVQNILIGIVRQRNEALWVPEALSCPGLVAA